MESMPKFSKQFIKMWWCAVLMGYISLGFLFVQLPDDKMHVYFLDVGQGDSIFIKTPQNHQILIDGGPKNTVIERLGEVMPFFDKSIDLLVLTHPDSDHLDGLLEVLKRFKVDSVVFTGILSSKAAYIEFLEEIYERGVDVFVAEEKVDFVFGDVYFDTIYPFEALTGSVEEMNDTSVVMRVFYKGTSLMLTGDLSVEKEKEIVAQRGMLESDILKAGHHGSKTSSSLEFLGRVSPEVVVIQCGKDNNFGHPHEEALENFEKAGVEVVRRNDLEGTVEFVF